MHTDCCCHIKQEDLSQEIPYYHSLLSKHHTRHCRIERQYKPLTIPHHFVSFGYKICAVGYCFHHILLKFTLTASYQLVFLLQLVYRHNHRIHYY